MRTPILTGTPGTAFALALVAAVLLPSSFPAEPAAAATAAATSASAAAVATPLFQVARVVDGDTITVRVGRRVEKVRLIGLDAPEVAKRECFAAQATTRLRSLVQGRSVRLGRDASQADRDRYGRLLRHVSLANGRLAAELMIEGGFAREYTFAAAYPQQARYRAAQGRAARAKRGLWAGCPITPAPVPVTPVAPAPVVRPVGCVIKGNISSTGEKIYHVPGGRSYAETVITPAKGERWFCSERDALAAGWRKARA